MGGSYLIEKLTLEISVRVREYLDEIEKQGGALAAVESGYIQAKIQDSAYRQQLARESGKAVQVGVNAYQVEEELTVAAREMDLELETHRLRQLNEIRSRRSQPKVDQLLEKLKHQAGGEENLMPVLIDCVEADLTLGEICGALREVWGEYRERI
jgi:methylmalonyl-CoA mutase N-terminal domain/subunit